MTSLVLTNNGQATLAAALTDTATQLTVASGQGALFPNPGPNTWFPLTLVKADGSGCEIVRAEQRSGDLIEVVRAQEGTTALSFAIGDFVSHRMTAAAHLDLASRGPEEIQESGGTTDAYTVAFEDVQTLTDGLAFSYVANTTNTGPATLKVGSLAALPIKKYNLDGSNVLEDLDAGEILQGRQALVHYEDSETAFILSNPNQKEVVTADTTRAGIVQLSSSGSFDPASGAEDEAMNERGTSAIIFDSLDPATGVYDPISGATNRPITQRTAAQVVLDSMADPGSVSYDRTTGDESRPVNERTASEIVFDSLLPTPATWPGPSSGDSERPVSQLGVVQILDDSLAPDPTAYDLGGDNTRPVTQLTASQIARDAVDATIAGRLPFIWRDPGDGAGGDITIPNGGTASLYAGDTHQYRNYTVEDGGQLDITGRGVCVFRCTESFTFNGTLLFPRGGYMGPVVVGPKGGVNDGHNGARTECNFLPAVWPGESVPANNDWATNDDSGRISVRQVEAAILNGLAMQAFQGGNSAVYREANQSFHKGGFIVIAPEINIGGTAVFSRMFPEPAADFSSNPERGPAAGGMMMLVSENITRASAALYEARLESTASTTDNHRTASQMDTDGPGIPPDATGSGAGNGMLFEVDRLTNDVTRVF